MPLKIAVRVYVPSRWKHDNDRPLARAISHFRRYGISLGTPEETSDVRLTFAPRGMIGATFAVCDIPDYVVQCWPTVYIGHAFAGQITTADPLNNYCTFETINQAVFALLLLRPDLWEKMDS